VRLQLFQSNHEGALIDAIQAARKHTQGIILNAGAYTHTSIALQDALRDFGGLAVEVHLSNVYGRESYRHQSFLSPVVTGVIAGFGLQGYSFALDALARKIIQN
jgi:3-dehydroquinate dehydratase-2